MQLWFWFVIALAPTLVLGFLLWNSLRQTSSILSQQIHMNQTLTNMILSKDPMTFQQIQATTNQLSAPSELVNPLDDQAAALALAEQYRANGLDPSMAFAQDDDVDFRAEFGL